MGCAPGSNPADLGRNDVALGKELTYGTEAYVANLTVRYIPNCGHWVQQEKPELVTQYMQEFLQLAD